MHKSDVKIINIKNLKLDEDDSNGSEDEQKSSGGENFFDEDVEESAEDFEDGSDGSAEIDNFLDSKKGGYDNGIFEDGSFEGVSEYEFSQNAGKGRKAPPSISDSMIEELSGDPMFLVLTRFLMSKKGNSIADILEEIRDHLAFIRAHIAMYKN